MKIDIKKPSNAMSLYDFCKFCRVRPIQNISFEDSEQPWRDPCGPCFGFKLLFKDVLFFHVPCFMKFVSYNSKGEVENLFSFGEGRVKYITITENPESMDNILRVHCEDLVGENIHKTYVFHFEWRGIEAKP